MGHIVCCPKLDCPKSRYNCVLARTVAPCSFSGGVFGRSDILCLLLCLFPVGEATSGGGEIDGVSGKTGDIRAFLLVGIDSFSKGVGGVIANKYPFSIDNDENVFFTVCPSTVGVGGVGGVGGT